MSSPSSDTSSEGELRADLPCMRCLQRATQDDASISPDNFCVFVPGSRCDYCDGRKDNLCKRVPTLYQKEASEILNLVDLIYAEDTPEDLREPAINEVKRLGEAVKKQWCVLNRRIRTGQHSWAEVQEFGVDGYTEEEVEGYFQGAKISDRETKDGDDGDGNHGSRANQGNANHGNGLVDQGTRTVSEHLPTQKVFTDAVSKMTEAVDSVNGTLMFMTNSMKMSHEEIGDLLAENLQLQREMVQAQKDMTGAIKQVVKEQKKIKVELRTWRASENATIRRISSAQLESPRAREDEGPLRRASRVLNAGDARDSVGSPKERPVVPRSTLKRKRTTH